MSSIFSIPSDLSSNLSFWLPISLSALFLVVAVVRPVKNMLSDLPTDLKSTTGSKPSSSSDSTLKSFTPSELSQYNGTNPDLPVYLAIKGTVFDVTKNKAMYVPGQGYHVFAGKDASKALGMSSLKEEDCVADYSGLNESQLKVLNDWESFYRKKYPVIGQIIQTDSTKTKKQN
ncbi:cytochrome b5-like heme/steroid binding domain-containing protein [Paraphysoderma sedebokerense]|nr:cytochrome b5-like heme/steroid binding domain-containing protein [Paraphysoderma sedebokerense]